MKRLRFPDLVSTSSFRFDERKTMSTLCVPLSQNLLGSRFCDSGLRSFLLLLYFPFLANATTGHDEYVGVFLWGSTLLAFAGRLAPHALRAAQSATLAALTTSMGVIYRVHGGTTHRWANTMPATPACLTKLHEA